MRVFKAVIVVLSFSFLNFTSLQAVEVVYSLSGLSGCEVVGTYKKTIRNKASKKNMEKKLRSMAGKDGATHVFVTTFIDNTNKGKGMKAKAEGRKCT
jgi:hypothetical protein